jgi:hypothetical protein
MGDEQKIWFIYLTDHHEGPFSVSEVAEKIGQGVVTPQSLGWKDGMPEWLPLESIPELGPALSGGGGGEAAPAEAPAGDGEGFSLAQMLASQQSVGAEEPSGSLGVSVTEEPSGQTPSMASSFSSPIDQPVDAGALIWMMRVGEQASGMYSLQQLKAMAAQGEIPASAQLWHQGWADFQPLSSVPDVASLRQDGKGMAGKTGMTARPAANTAMNRPRGLAPITASADVGNDDPTDPGISSPKKSFLDKIKALFPKKKSKAAAAPASRVVGKKKAAGGIMGSVKRIAPVLGGLVLIGAGAAAYFLYFSSPIPSDLDVIPDDLEAMRQVVKQPASQPQLYLALARGTEDSPADVTAPKFYVATNLPESTAVTIQLNGHPGTLVNRISFDKTYTGTVGGKHMAVFESLQDDGKPLPMGEYTMTVTATGAPPLAHDRFLGGRKGGAYTSRLAKYKEKLQGEYDKEMQTLKEYIDTLKSLQGELSKRVKDYNTQWQNPGMRTKIVNEWRNFVPSAQGILSQMDQKVKAYLGSGAAIFNQTAFTDVTTTLSQMAQLIQIHGQRLSGQQPASNPNDLDGLVQAAVASLDQWLAQALVKNPMDVLMAKGQPPAPQAGTPPPAAPVPAPATAAAPAPAAPAQ